MIPVVIGVLGGEIQKPEEWLQLRYCTEHSSSQASGKEPELEEHAHTSLCSRGESEIIYNPFFKSIVYNTVSSAEHAMKSWYNIKAELSDLIQLACCVGLRKQTVVLKPTEIL